VGRNVDVDDLLDANGVAELLGFAHRNTVSVYQHRYPDMPRPVREFGERRAKLWLRSEIEGWRAAADRGRSTKESPATDLDTSNS
jgi:predicted DNA-binding transcriptional regulator AlpA